MAESANPAPRKSTFFSLPDLVRDMIYDELLVFSAPIILEMATDSSGSFYGVVGTNSLGASPRIHLCPEILVVNRRAYEEAGPLLYSKNRFRLRDSYLREGETQDGILALFLHTVGQKNAHHLRHVCITFPTVYDGNLREESILTLELIKCTSITRIETVLHPHTRPGTGTGAEALALVDTHFGAISPPREVIVNVFEDEVDKMRGYRWKIKAEEAKDISWIFFVRKTCGLEFRHPGLGRKKLRPEAIVALLLGHRDSEGRRLH